VKTISRNNGKEVSILTKSEISKVNENRPDSEFELDEK